MTLYRSILKRAWFNAWQNKYLWFFGLFAAFFTNTGFYLVFGKALSGEFTKNPFPMVSNIVGFFSADGFSDLGRSAAESPFSLFMIMLIYMVFICLFLFIIWLSMVSQAGLVNNLAQLMSNKKTDLNTGMKVGSNRFWPVFAVNLFLKVILYLGFLLISLPFIMGVFTQTSLIDNLIFVLSFIVYISLGIILSFIIKYSIAYFVIKENSLFDGIKSAWSLFIKNWLISIELALILALIDFVISFLMFVVILIITVPFVFMAILLGTWGSIFGFWLLMLVALFIAIAIICFERAILTVFQISAWTDLFIILIGRGAVSRLVKLSSGLMRK